MYFKTAIVKKPKICVEFDADRQEYLKILSHLKSLYGAQAEKLPDGRWQWLITDSERSRGVLRNLGFEIEEKNQEASDMPGVSALLRNYQKDGVRFLDQYEGSVLLGDEPGLGKTCQSLSYVSYKDRYPLLIICPATLKLNWRDEYSLWCGDEESVEVLKGTKPYRVGAKVLIVNYDILTYWLDYLIKWNPLQIIADEVQAVKRSSGKTAKRTKAFMSLCSGKPLIALSGTPLENRTFEFFNILHLLRPKMFPSVAQYGARFCGTPTRNFYTGNWEYKGSKNMKELHKMLETVMLRRLKKDVLKDLPPKLRISVPMEIDAKDRREYSELENKIDNARQSGSYIEIKNTLETLKQAVARMKMKSVIAWITEYLESEDKLVVFAEHRFVIAELLAAFPGISVKIDGSVTGEARHTAVQRFQTDPGVRLLFGNLKAAGVGLTLTAASATATVEISSGPAIHLQAEDRVHRIGQEADSVFAFYLLARGTIEEKLVELIDRKQRIISTTLDGTPVKEDEFPLLELLNTSSFKRRSQLVGI